MSELVHLISGYESIGAFCGIMFGDETFVTTEAERATCEICIETAKRLQPKNADEAKIIYRPCPNCGVPFENGRSHTCRRALHHVRGTIKVGASLAEEAMSAFKEISAILEKTSFEVRPRVLKALNEIYRD